MESKSLKEWWNSFVDGAKGQKLRYVGWDHKVKYFTPSSLDARRQELQGKLDSGEQISFSIDSRFWVNYEEGMEENARAV